MPLFAPVTKTVRFANDVRDSAIVRIANESRVFSDVPAGRMLLSNADCAK
jgi:hypothetical protein